MTPTQEQEFLARFEDMLQEGRRARNDLFERSQVAQDFYKGRHWTAAEIEGYKSKGVVPITINHCLPVVNTISGMERQNRQDIRVFPRNGGTTVVAGILTELVNHTMSQSDGKFVASENFREGIVSSEDYLFIERDKSTTPNGRLVVKRRSCFAVIPDPAACEYDLNESGRWLIDREWVDKEVIEAMYPDSKADLETTDFGKPNDPLASLISYFYGDDYDDDDTTDNDVIARDEYKKKSRHLVLKVWWKETVPGLVWMDTQTGGKLTLTKQKDMAKAKRTGEAMPDRFKITSTTRTTLHKTVLVGRVVLEDEENPMGDTINEIPFIRFAPYWLNGYAFGVLDNVIGPQREENINRTQATRLLNQTANSGWLVKKVSALYKKVLEKFGSVPGVVIEEELCGGKAERLAPNQLSTGHAALSERSAVDIREISSVNDALQGYETDRAESGRALGLKQQQGRTGIEPVLDNFRWTLRLLGEMLVKMILNLGVYTDDEIRAVIGESKLVDPQYMEKAKAELGKMLDPTGIQMPRQPMPVNTAVAAQLPPAMQQTVVAVVEDAFKTNQQWEAVVKRHAVEMLLAELKKDSVREYGVEVDTSPSTPTIRMANMFEMVEINRMYPGAIPPDIMIEASSIPNKDEIVARLKQNQATMAMAAGSHQAQGAAA